MEIIKEGIVFRKEDGPFRYNAWSTICRDDAGKLYVAWSGERVQHVCPFGKNLMAVSEDGGESWTCPMIINDTWLDDRDAGICSLGGDKLIMSYFNNKKYVYLDQLPRIAAGTEEFSKAMTMAYVDEYNRMAEGEQPDGEVYHYGSFTRVSLDGGKTWEKANRAPVSSPHGPIMKKDGRLIWMGVAFAGQFGDSGDVMVVESDDMGKSWTHLATIDVPRDMVVHGNTGDALDFCEPDIEELDDGTLLGCIRVQGKSDNYLEMCQTMSTDGGKTWTKAVNMGLCGAPPHYLKLRDGRIVLTYSRREAPSSIRGVISCDGGKSWGEEFIISNAPNRDLGYPSSVELDDGTIVTVFYKIVPPATKTAIVYTKWRI